MFKKTLVNLTFFALTSPFAVMAATSNTETPETTAPFSNKVLSQNHGWVTVVIEKAEQSTTPISFATVPLDIVLTTSGVSASHFSYPTKGLVVLEKMNSIDKKPFIEAAWLIYKPEVAKWVVAMEDRIIDLRSELSNSAKYFWRDFPIDNTQYGQILLSLERIGMDEVPEEAIHRAFAAPNGTELAMVLNRMPKVKLENSKHISVVDLEQNTLDSSATTNQVTISANVNQSYVEGRSWFNRTSLLQRFSVGYDRFTNLMQQYVFEPVVREVAPILGDDVSIIVLTILTQF